MRISLDIISIISSETKKNSNIGNNNNNKFNNALIFCHYKKM
jgi:hypothetical protein